MTIALFEIFLPLLMGLTIIVQCATGCSDSTVRDRRSKRGWIAMLGVLTFATLVWAVGPSRTVGRWAELQLLWIAPVLFWSAVALRAGNRNASRSRNSRIARNSTRFLVWFVVGIGLSWATSLMVLQYFLLSPRDIVRPFHAVLLIGEWVELFLPALTSFHGRMDGWAWNRAILCAMAALLLWRSSGRSAGVGGRHQLLAAVWVPLQALSVLILALVGISVLAPSGCQSWRFGWCEGRLAVPVNPQSKSGATIEVSYLLRPSPGGAPRGVIVAAIGGPVVGGSAVKSSLIAALGSVADTHDVLISDYRGFGRSHYVGCPGVSVGPATKESVERCTEHLGPLATELSAQRAADDLEAIRKHLGLERIDIYGQSYGTFFAQTYAQLYPEAVRSVVLDSSLPLHGELGWSFIAYQLTGEHPLQRFCAHYGECDSDAKLVPAWREVVKRAREERWDSPSVIDLATIHVYSIWSEVDRGRVEALMLEGEQRRAALAAMGDRLRRQIEAMRAGEDGGWMSVGPTAAYACNDYPAPFAWNSAYAEREEAVRAFARARFSENISPFTWDEFNQATRSSSGIAVNGYRYEACLYWDYGDASPPRYGAAPPVDMLIITPLRDTTTTPEMAAKIAAVWPGSKMLPVAGGDHWVTANPQADCAREEMAKFIEDPKGYVPSECSVPWSDSP